MATTPFPYPDDLTRFPKETQRVLSMLHDLGWALRWQGNNRNVVAARAPAPNNTKTINIPRTNINADRMKSWLHQIERYTDSERFAEWVEDNTAAPEPTPAPAPPPARVPDTAVAAAMQEAMSRTRDTEEDERIIRKYNDDDLPPHGDDDPVYEVEVAQFRDGDPSVRLLTEKPWMVRRGGQNGKGGRMYESPVVLHRVWSDGSEDYRCRKCPYTNANPRSISSHNSQAHPENRMDRSTIQIRHVPDYEATDIKRPMSAVRRLTSDLLHVLDGIEWQNLSKEELAEVLAGGVYDLRPDREPAEPLTPEQIIARIVGLVDQGRLADMHQKVERTAAALVEQTEARNRLTTELIAAQAENARLHEERRILRDLLSESEAS